MATKAQTGTVVFKEGNYFLEVEGKYQPIPVGPHIDVGQLKQLVGQKVEVVHSEPKSFVIGLVQAGEKIGVKRVGIICYLPPVDRLFGVVQEEARAAFATQLLKEGILSQANYEKLQ